MTNRYQTIVPNGHGGGMTYPDHLVNPVTREEAYAVAARIPGSFVQVSANGVFGWQDDVADAPRAARTYSARRIAARFYEYTHDGITPCNDDEAFNYDMATYSTDDDIIVFDSVAELARADRPGCIILPGIAGIGADIAYTVERAE